MIDNSTIFSVSGLVGAIAGTLRANFYQIRLTGEVGQFTRATSGHWYLTLKDDSAQIKAVMFRQRNVLAGFTPKVGDRIEGTAELGLYETKGELQVILQTLKPAGQGNLHEQFQKLKQKLFNEGLFETDHKKPLPSYVFNVAIVTSAQAAAFADVKRALSRRTPHISWVLYPTSVQGDAATAQIVDALQQADSGGHDAVLLVRGGGSLEDLWCFNEEAVVRAIFAMITPVVVGVGHETDVTLAEFVADLRAATPTAAAEQISQTTAELLAHVAYCQERIQTQLQRYLHSLEQRIDRLEAEILTPHERVNLLDNRVESAVKHLAWCMGAMITRRSESVAALGNRLPVAIQSKTTQAVNLLSRTEISLTQSAQRSIVMQAKQLESLAGLMEANSISRNLNRGYAILQAEDGSVVSRASQVQVGTALSARVADGKLSVSVSKVAAEKKPN